MIFYIALGVVALALLIRLCWRQIKRTQMNKLYFSEAYRKWMLEKPDECELTDTTEPFVIDKKPFQLYRAGIYTLGEAINETRKRAGYPPLKFEHGEDTKFYWPPPAHDEEPCP